MESINWKRIPAALLAALGFTVVLTLIFGSFVTSTPSYAEVSEDDVKVYEPAAAAACDDGLSASIHYEGYSKDTDEHMYSLTGRKWIDSYATGIKSSDKDDMLAEVMDELCGNPSALYAAIDGLQYTMEAYGLKEEDPASEELIDYDFLEANPWAAEYIEAADKHGLRHFMVEDETTKSHRQVASRVNTLLLNWDNTGVVKQQVTIANWADISGGMTSGELPRPAPRYLQEDLPALKLVMQSAKGIGCVAAIGFNVTDKRFEVLDCATPGEPVSEPTPQEVTVVPSEKPSPEPEPTPTEEPTPEPEPEPTPTTEPEPTPTEEPTPEPEPEPTPTTEPEPTPTEAPTPEPEPEPTPTPTPEEPTEPMPSPNPKDRDREDYRESGDNDARDAGDDIKPDAVETGEPEDEPEPVVTDTSDDDSGVTDSSTKEPESESGVTAPDAEENTRTNPDQDSGSDEPTDDDSLEDEVSQEPEITQPTEDPDPVEVDEGPVNDEEVSLPEGF